MDPHWIHDFARLQEIARLRQNFELEKLIVFSLMNNIRLTEEPKTLRNLKRGDVVRTDNYYRCVLEVYPSGETYLLSAPWIKSCSEGYKAECRTSVGICFTAQELERRDYTHVSPNSPEPEAMTKEQIEQALGKKIEIVE